MAKLRSVAHLTAAIAAIATATVHGFAPSAPSAAAGAGASATSHSNRAGRRSHQGPLPPRSSTVVATALREKKKGSNLDRNVSNKLLEETVAPFRGLRLFLYAALASGAFIGGLITASGVAAALSGVRSDVDLDAEYLNLAIDFGAVAIFGVLAKFDLDKGAELSAAVEEKVERKKARKEATASMRSREQDLRYLEVDVRVTEDGGTRTAPVGVMQKKAKQHVILVAGPGRAIRDALRGAQLNKVNFAMTNILVVPYRTGDDAAERAARPDGGGFGDARPSYETQPYVAEPVGDGWEEFVAAEMETAAEQAGDKVFEEGIALMIANNGKVLRRGVGKVPWRQMVDELEEAVTGEKKETSIPLLEFLE